MEFTEISVRRKLRHDAFSSPGVYPRKRKVVGFKRGDPAVAGAEFRRRRRWSAVQSGRGFTLFSGLAHLYCHGVVSPQAPHSAGGAGTAIARGGSVCDGRLFAGPRSGFDLEPRAQNGDCDQAAQLHRTSCRLHRAREFARQWRRVRKNAAGRADHDRPSGYQVRGTHHRSDEQGGRLRSAVGRDLLGLCFGVQRLRAHDAQIRPEENLQGGVF